MIDQIFKAFILTSCVGTILTAVLLLARPITYKIFSSHWHYYMWLVVLTVMVLPVKFGMPIDKNISFSDAVISETTDDNINFQANRQYKAFLPKQEPQTSTLRFEALKEITDGMMNVLPTVWLLGVLCLLLLKILGYAVFIRKIKKSSDIITCPEILDFTSRKITVRVSDSLISPLMIGVFRPILLLPKAAITSQQLHNVLCHEMTHFRRNDVLYKWFVTLVRCVHWFNPIIYFVARQVNIDCEISCDMAVTSKMSDDEIMGYVGTILALLSNKNAKSVPLTTGMTSSKNVLKRRFIMIKKKTKISRAVQIISTVLAAAIMLTTVLASGALAAEIFNEQYTIEIVGNGERLEFINQPYFENNTVYLPLRETLENLGFMDNAGSKIEWDNEEILVYIESASANALGYYGITVGEAWLDIYTYSNTDYISRGMFNSPVIKDGTTYVPFEYINYMIDNSFDAEEYGLVCSVWDKNNGGTDREADYKEILGLW